MKNNIITGFFRRLYYSFVKPKSAPGTFTEQIITTQNDRLYTATEELKLLEKQQTNHSIKLQLTGDKNSNLQTARWLAAQQQKELYKIDLSKVVSKYIGETEKNLARIFDSAESKNAVLFFDEADAIFGKRTGIRDAHDRYANIETNYLLQRIGQYEGTVLINCITPDCMEWKTGGLVKMKT